MIRSIPGGMVLTVFGTIAFVATLPVSSAAVRPTEDELSLIHI